jgi:hypothetical protein
VFIKVIIIEVRVRVTLRSLPHDEGAKYSICMVRNCKKIYLSRHNSDVASNSN